MGLRRAMRDVIMRCHDDVSDDAVGKGRPTDGSGPIMRMWKRSLRAE